MSAYLSIILEYLRNRGFNEETITNATKDPTKLALAIMAFVHRGRHLESGEESEGHPMRCLQYFRALLGFNDKDGKVYSPTLLEEFNIPYDGVEELILLHDALDSGELTIEMIEIMFKECHFDYGFVKHLIERLEILHYDQTMIYKDYMKACMSNIYTAFVKFIDLNDNFRILEFKCLTDKRVKKLSDDLEWIFKINKKHRFLEHIRKYRSEAALVRATA